MARFNVRELMRWVLIAAMALYIAYLAADVITQTLYMLGLGSAQHDGSTDHYGHWALVAGSVGILSFFTIAYVVPIGRRNWRSAGLLQGFIIALFTEMYGFPLTVYVIASLLGKRIANPAQADGHLFGRAIAAIFGIDASVGDSGVMALASATMIVGFLLILFGWQRIYQARGQLVTGGLYRYVRHPQYTGILLITLALLVHWPTFVTVLMWPALLYTYYRLARREERAAEESFGDTYVRYRQSTSMFLPRI